MSSDSSSSEEETSRLKEAVDTTLLKDELYKNVIMEEEEQPKPSKSLRNENNKVASTNPFSLKVTPEFQKYVSQYLSKLLDRTIDDTEKFLKVRKQGKKPIDGGVRLLFTSKKFLNLTENIQLGKNPRKCTEKNDKDDIDYEARAREVAVTPEWILSKEEVKSWAPNWRNNMEIVELSNCKRKKKNP